VPRKLRTVAVADCDAAEMYISRRTLAAPASNAFNELDELGLRRLLRGLHIVTTDMDAKQELLQELRFQIDCDDVLFDNSKMPAKLEQYQTAQACMHLLMCAPLPSSLYSAPLAPPAVHLHLFSLLCVLPIRGVVLVFIISVLETPCALRATKPDPSRITHTGISSRRAPVRSRRTGSAANSPAPATPQTRI
jgi:hypothetical protein